jgi:hypothetical protein
MDQALVDAVRQARRAIGTKLRIDYVGMVEDFRGSICELHVRGNFQGQPRSMDGYTVMTTVPCLTCKTPLMASVIGGHARTYLDVTTLH